MTQTEQQLMADIKAKKFKPVYLITGEENYYIDLISDFMENNIVEESIRDFDQTVVYGRDVDMRTVISLAKQFPMMSPVKLVLVKEAQDLKDWDLLPLYLENPMPQTMLVFCYRHKKLDKRGKPYKAINEKGIVYEHAAIRDYQVPDWILHYVSDHGYHITESSARLLAEYLGTNLGKIVNEISKLFVSLPKGATINNDEIESKIGISKDYNIFELQKAIGTKDAAKCLRIVNHFAANPKDNPIQMIIPVLYGYLIKVMIYHQLGDDMGVSPYVIRDYAAASKNYSLGKLATCIGYLYEYDKKSKGIGSSTTTVPDAELLKELLFKIIH